MTLIYTKLTDDFGSTIIQRTNTDGTIDSIPADPANSDYQDYLATL